MAAAEQLSALEGAADEVQLAHMSEQLALKLALTPVQGHEPSPDPDVPQVGLPSRLKDHLGCACLMVAARQTLACAAPLTMTLTYHLIV